jgi:hypothetical protein
LTEADYAPAGSYLVDQRVVGATTYHVFDAIDYTSNPAGVALKVLSTNLSGTGTLYSNAATPVAYATPSGADIAAGKTIQVMNRGQTPVDASLITGLRASLSLDQLSLAGTVSLKLGAQDASAPVVIAALSSASDLQPSTTKPAAPASAPLWWPARWCSRGQTTRASPCRTMCTVPAARSGPQAACRAATPWPM